jgi:hypothetical protein
VIESLRHDRDAVAHRTAGELPRPVTEGIATQPATAGRRRRSTRRLACTARRRLLRHTDAAGEQDDKRRHGDEGGNSMVHLISSAARLV